MQLPSVHRCPVLQGLFDRCLAKTCAARYDLACLGTGLLFLFVPCFIDGSCVSAAWEEGKDRTLADGVIWDVLGWLMLLFCVYRVYSCARCRPRPDYF